MKKIYQLLKNIKIYNQKKEGCEFFFLVMVISRLCATVGT